MARPLFGFNPAFTGSWEDRLAGLFDCEVDFAGRSVLDAGCNMGLILYEIGKHGPAFLHGIDRYRRAMTVARRLFTAVKTPHRFDLVDVFDDRRLQAILRPDYDIVLIMALWQHIHRSSPQRAERFLQRVAGLCREAIIFRGSEEWGEHFGKAIAPHGFALAYRGPRLSPGAGPILVFRRAEPGNAGG